MPSTDSRMTAATIARGSTMDKSSTIQSSSLANTSYLRGKQQQHQRFLQQQQQPTLPDNDEDCTFHKNLSVEDLNALHAVFLSGGRLLPPPKAAAAAGGAAGIAAAGFDEDEDDEDRASHSVSIVSSSGSAAAAGAAGAVTAAAAGGSELAGIDDDGMTNLRYKRLKKENLENVLTKHFDKWNYKTTLRKEIMSKSVDQLPTEMLASETSNLSSLQFYSNLRKPF